ncbi:unnamed protein product [Paramecium sonneborni]|uniref:Uncharacterized protein n=1 Tax=Paramecium sonneborni TaxID=65129 RepID=A0A8S1KXJ5_9CILI|nr:unnamed protein product [Paramecium sonneborni]
MDVTNSKNLKKIYFIYNILKNAININQGIQIFNGLYVLCYEVMISSSQKGHLKGMEFINQKDQQILEIVGQFNKEECIQELKRNIQQILIDQSSESQSLVGNTLNHQQWYYRLQDKRYLGSQLIGKQRMLNEIFTQVLKNINQLLKKRFSKS